MSLATDPCHVCRGKKELQVNCQACFGSGYMRDVDWCPRPWDEVYPGLWTGGHDWAGDPPSWHGVTSYTHDLVEAGFQTVISFYSRPGCLPPPSMESYYLAILDGDLDEDELKRVKELAHIAAERVREGRKVLIRCQAGLNRSSLCTAFALKELTGWPMEKIIDHIRETRSLNCLCNWGFVDILLASEGDPG